jgi:hypothetical protein
LKWLLWLAIVVGGFVGGLIIFIGIRVGPCSEYDARQAAQVAVKRGLKAPATAQFSNEQVRALASKEPRATSEQARRFEPKYFRATGSVDAQNSFGALIRNEYSMTPRCSTVLVGSGEWSAEEFELR